MSLMMITGVLLSAIAAVLARQTNTVWLVFIAGSVLVPGSLSESATTTTTTATSIAITTDTATATATASIYQYVQYALWPARGFTLAHATAVALLFPVAFFVYFVLAMNEGSIVLGDKQNHAPIVHLAMPLHALAITSLCLCLSSSNRERGPLHEQARPNSTAFGLCLFSI